ncbi:DUF5682 family protein [Aeoliella mucimassa]|uniref:Uncharacterized protein n=1 Tax=Aeoliella mucimassa TaxID=2527972 RepID=A0A518ALY2_9BACT|nr:DUF5682 family protein [Aeoliella mucimassa]QDU55716.1 hypothetical protein Pan181_19100 [Aeoliella mucimassa]
MSQAGKQSAAAIRQSGLDTEAIAEQVDQVLGEDLYWFPVRHHSPGVAYHVQRTILARKPKVIFLEGPAEAQDLLPHVIDSKTKPPVAIYSSYRDDDNVLGLAGIASESPDIPARFASWYPLVAYSPEYVTLQAATKTKADVVFMDLPHYAEITPRSDLEPLEEPPPAEVLDQDANPASAATHDSDQLLFSSRFYQQLAKSAGFRSWNEAWDTLFELDADQRDTEEFRRELATFCAASRRTSPAERLAIDGTLDRERHMWHTIRQTLKTRKLKPKDCMVVCGGFHLFLDRDDLQPPSELPAGTVYTSVVPYSFFRISELSGYGAGNRAPQYYQTWWELVSEGRPTDLLAEHVVSVLKRARKEGEPLSSADAISVSQHARMLARLRGRTSPVLDDIHDALVTCCCKGDPADVGIPLQRAIDAVDVGNKLGRVTPALGRLPLVSDFYGNLDELQLAEVMSKEKRQSVQLDKREQFARRRSCFLHRVEFLKVPLGKLVDASTQELATGTLFRERWELRWSPKVEAELVERNLYGDTIESAALAQLEEDLAKHASQAGAMCARLVWAVNMDLPGAVQRAEQLCGEAIDDDSRFVSLCQAITHLTVIDRYAEYRGLVRQQLAELIVRAYDRACFALPAAANVPEQEQNELVEALRSLAELVIRDEKTRDLDRTLFTQSVRSAAQQTNVPFLRGAFLGMLAEMREIPTDELAHEVSALASAPIDTMVTAGDLLDGIMAVSRSSLLLGAESLIEAIDTLLKAADWDAFLVMVPRMRAAFDRLHDRHVETLAECVARRYGLAEETSLTELSTSVGAAALFARIDAEVANILSDWEF